MSATTFDQHVYEALALIAPTRQPATPILSARSAGAPQHGGPRLALVRLPSSHARSRK
ncbi:hypothetical protein [Streptomyces sp. NPDC007172]|uniref:hypothetical protein n=1 Tax=Streptomyces sp. NPDC007172 TaxID=3364776 RepID=UPI0036B83E60